MNYGNPQMDYYDVPQDQSSLDPFGILQGQGPGSDQLNALLDNPDLRMGPGYFVGEGGDAGQGEQAGFAPETNPIQIAMFKRALQKGEERRARLQQGRGEQVQWMPQNNGQGGGGRNGGGRMRQQGQQFIMKNMNVANQVYAKTAGNLLSGFDASPNGMDDVNRGWEGVQNAYNVQAGVRANVRIAEIKAAAEREIAQKKYDTQQIIADRILPSQLFGRDPSRLTGFEANTGGSMQLPQRSQFRRFSPGQ